MSLIQKPPEVRARMREDILRWQSQHGELFDEPHRGEPFDEEGVVAWRHGAPPEYTVGNHAFLKGKTQMHKKGDGTN